MPALDFMMFSYRMRRFVRITVCLLLMAVSYTVSRRSNVYFRSRDTSLSILADNRVVRDYRRRNHTGSVLCMYPRGGPVAHICGIAFFNLVCLCASHILSSEN
jgi:hypothetical protein